MRRNPSEKNPVSDRMSDKILLLGIATVVFSLLITVSSGGTGGQSNPLITKTVNGYIITNIAPLSTFNVTLNNLQINVVENYITPTSAGITVEALGSNASTYILNTGASYQIPSSSTSEIYLSLENVSYLPIEHTITLGIYSNSSVNRTANTVLNVIINGQGEVNVTPADLANTVSVSNDLSNSPQAPQNYVKILAFNISVNSMIVNSINMTAAYPCSVASDDVIPFELENSKWIEMNLFSPNATACTVSFDVGSDPVIAVMQYVAPVTTSTTPTTSSVTSTTTKQTTTIPASSNTLSELRSLYNYLYYPLVIIGGVSVAVIVIETVRIKRKKNSYNP